ncbi:uncharacterized protein LOC123265332 isoform X1 [Cotesia glomerata]|uniref:Centriolar coiled-coil protein of 110 kDa n=1 Tax=Cotesia glomerata TaxID=32391 RepID=A0AAV7IU45_COTGL|nr:uncharacterized protein LOC123265332 isoform X1 [Cotesia glomerata]KAH0560208.1 hypothetical protein KQX54_002509 [Cotesia glomerata]
MDSYVSCIKVRGTRILPPVMTDELRAEMNYYKQLALEVEERLSRLETISTEEVEEEIENSFEEDKPPDSKTSIFYRQESVTSFTGDSPEQSKGEINKISCEQVNDGWKGRSDDETITNSTDVNKYINTSGSSKTDTSEVGKPCVPKTLDIIPITVDHRNLIERKASSDVEEADTEVPKLVRQGSYTLESPSPMLLAHFQQPENDYVPTSTANGVKPREWSVNYCKVEWTLKEKQGIGVKNNHQTDNDLIDRRNSISEDVNKKDYKLIGKKTDKQSSSLNHAAKSVDCIQSMLTKENFSSTSNHQSNIPVVRSKSSNAVKNYLNNFKNSIEICSVAKIYGAQKAFSNGNSPTSRKKYADNKMTRSFEGSSTDQYDSRPVDKSKPVVTSEKLLQVFKEIQKTHHHQMAHLIARQQKEQIIMQQEFEKQQLMLLEQLEKTCPGISLPAIIKKITTPVDKLKRYNSPRDSVSLPKDNQNRSDSESSPLNGSSFGSEGSLSIHFTSHDASLSESKTNRERRSSVSRQLFPLECKSTHVPITNGAVYDDRHIKAATIINAYVRGYLTRRLMKTERVMTLKNTYREALHCMLKLHVDAPWELAELNFHKRLQHQCDAASMSIVELFSQSPSKRMSIISQDRQVKQARQQRPTSAKSSYSFATQRTLARKKFKEMGIITMPEPASRNREPCTARTRCQTWTSNSREKRSPGLINQGIKRSTSAGAVRKPWR